jgi:hypothetical protein
VAKTDGSDGWADVWHHGFFGWEYKGKHKDLGEAYKQLLQYREDLEPISKAVEQVLTDFGRQSQNVLHHIEPRIPYVFGVVGVAKRDLWGSSAVEGSVGAPLVAVGVI